MLFSCFIYQIGSFGCNGRSKNRGDQHLRVVTSSERGFLRIACLHHPNWLFFRCLQCPQCYHRRGRRRQVLAIPFIQMFGECHRTKLFAQTTDFHWATEKSCLGCQRAPLHVALGALACHLIVRIMVLKERASSVSTPGVISVIQNPEWTCNQMWYSDRGDDYWIWWLKKMK